MTRDLYWWMSAALTIAIIYFLYLAVIDYIFLGFFTVPQ